MGSPDENGYYKVSADDIDSLQVNPDDNYSGDIKLEVNAQSQESDPFVADKETATTETSQEIVINVNPIADTVRISLSDLKSPEDEAINLATIINITPTDDNDDGSEAYFVRIYDLPEGAEITVNGEVMTPNSEGVYEIPLEDLENAELIHQKIAMKTLRLALMVW